MEHVVLVDCDNQVLGTMDKREVHGANTPLHRAFSVFVFNERRQLLLQLRAADKLAWPLFWSNSCCGHPALHESNVDAVLRRCRFELGIEVTAVLEVAPYQYCFSHQDIMENEICPILVARYDGEVNANPDEVAGVDWLDWQQWLQNIADKPEAYSPWSVEETAILLASDRFNQWLGQMTHL